MFEVLISQMEFGCNEIEKQIKEIMFISEELTGVIKEMKSLCGLEEYGILLGDIQGDIEEEKAILRMLTNVLSKSLVNYVCCENRIISECEQSHYLYARRDMGLVRIF